MKNQCGTCVFKPDQKEFNSCYVVLDNYTVIERNGVFLLSNDLTGQTELINCKHWEGE